VTVEELLAEEKIPFKVSPADFVVSCLNPEHDDSNPSMRIDKITGIFNCFSCGFKGNIFKLYDKPSNFLDIKREKLRQKIEEKRSASVGLKMPTDIMPYVGNERNIKPDTYKKFEAFMSSRSPFGDRIVFPIRDITGKIVAFNGRLRQNSHIKDQPKYVIHPPKAIMPMYPTNITPIKGRVVLVEGIYDVINLHDKGLTNALCSFGISNITPEKLLLLKMKGIEQIDIMFDPDDAGQAAVEKVQELCDKVEIKHYHVKIPPEYGDAGELNENTVLKLKENLYG
jgi:DNA primase